jgi:membrane protein implicated in regulation of membrane protease activity
MMSTIASFGIWNWFIAGGILLAIEVIAPGTFMLWLGLSALLVGAISLLVEWPWQAQFVAFAVFSIASIPIWHRIGRKIETPVDQPFLNRRSEAFVGQTFTLDKPIVNGSGGIRIGDTVCRVSGPDTAAGSRVKVTRADGALLFVEPVTEQV